MKKKFVLSTASKTALRQRVRLLDRENAYLHEQVYSSISSYCVPYTLERDMKAGHTVQVRVPKKFMASGWDSVKKNIHAQALGRKGARARARILTKAERIAIATKASHSRKVYLDAQKKLA